MDKKEKDWKSLLTPEQFHITRQGGTEPPFSGIYNDHKESGVYSCVCCKNELFSSEEKFSSGSGWPSFTQAVEEDRIKIRKDSSLGMIRMEVLCGNCGAHLGHLFEDGPEPTGLRYCINSIALNFETADR